MRTLGIGATIAVATLLSGCIQLTSTAGTATPGQNAIATARPQAPGPTSVSQPGVEGLCALFTPDEISAYVGAPVDGGLGNSQINTCVWTTDDGEGTVLLQQVPASYYEEHTLDPGYHKVTGIGETASITDAIQGDGLSLTVKQGDGAYFVDLVPATDDQQVIDLARVFISRYEAL